MLMNKRKPLSSKFFFCHTEDIQSISCDFSRANRMIFGEGIFSSMGMSFFSKKKEEKRTMYYLGDRHRAHRKLFNPAFSIAHMRDIGMCQRICIKDNPFDQTVIFISSNFL